MPPDTGVEWVWVESAVGSKGLGKVDMRGTEPARCGGNRRMN